MMYSVPATLVSFPEYFPKQDTVAGFDVERDQVAVAESLAATHSDHLAFLRFLLGGIGDDDAVPRGFLFVDALDHDAVVQGANVHVVSSLLVKPVRAQFDGALPVDL
jgi:hypothetical protein